jgi:hypothetical protein
MDWHLALSLAVLPVALYSQLRTRKVNALALWLSPLIYLLLGAHAAWSAARTGLNLLLPLLLLGSGAALGYAQGSKTTVFYDLSVQNYRQRGGAWPLGFWAAALLLRQGGAWLLTRGLPPAAARLSTGLTIDAVLLGLLAGRAVVLLRRHPGLWRAGAAQLRGETTAPPPPELLDAVVAGGGVAAAAPGGPGGSRTR